MKSLTTKLSFSVDLLQRRRSFESAREYLRPSRAALGREGPYRCRSAGSSPRGYLTPARLRPGPGDDVINTALTFRGSSPAADDDVARVPQIFINGCSDIQRDGWHRGRSIDYCVYSILTPRLPRKSIRQFSWKKFSYLIVHKKVLIHFFPDFDSFFLGFSSRRLKIDNNGL